MGCQVRGLEHSHVSTETPSHTLALKGAPAGYSQLQLQLQLLGLSNYVGGNSRSYTLCHKLKVCRSLHHRAEGPQGHQLCVQADPAGDSWGGTEGVQAAQDRQLRLLHQGMSSGRRAGGRQPVLLWCGMCDGRGIILICTTQIGMGAVASAGSCESALWRALAACILALSQVMERASAKAAWTLNQRIII